MGTKDLNALLPLQATNQTEPQPLVWESWSRPTHLGAHHDISCASKPELDVSESYLRTGSLEADWHWQTNVTGLGNVSPSQICRCLSGSDVGLTLEPIPIDNVETGL